MREEIKTWIAQLAPVPITGAISYYSGIAGNLFGLGGGLFLGGLTAKQLGRFLRRRKLEFTTRSLQTIYLLLKNAKTFHATSTIPFEDWLSPVSITYLILQYKNIKPSNFERICLIENIEKEANKQSASLVAGLHSLFGLHSLLYCEVDKKLRKEISMYDFSIINVHENEEKVRVVLEPKSSPKGDIDIITFWSKETSLMKSILRMDIEAYIDAEKVSSRSKDWAKFRDQAKFLCYQLREPKYWPFFKTFIQA